MSLKPWCASMISTIVIAPSRKKTISLTSADDSVSWAMVSSGLAACTDKLNINLRLRSVPTWEFVSHTALLYSPSYIRYLWFIVEYTLYFRAIWAWHIFFIDHGACQFCDVLILLLPFSVLLLYYVSTHEFYTYSCLLEVSVNS